MRMRLYGTLTPAKCMLHPRNGVPPDLTAAVADDAFPHATARDGSRLPSAALHLERVMSLSTTALNTGRTAGKLTPPRYMVLYDCTSLAGKAVLRAFGHAASNRASVFIAGLLLPETGETPKPDLQDELDALVRTGKRAGVHVTAEIVEPPTMEAMAEKADAENVTHVICMHPPHALHEVFTKRGILMTLRD